MLWIMSLVIVLLLVVRRWKIQRFVNFAKNIKCDIKSYPLIGHAYLFVGNSVNRMSVLQRFGREAIRNGGLTNLWIGGEYYVLDESAEVASLVPQMQVPNSRQAELFIEVVVDGGDLEVILKTALEKADIMRLFRNLTGNGLIFARVPIWRPRRRIMGPIYSQNNLKHFVEVFARQSRVTVNKLKTVGNEVVSISKYYMRYSLDSISEIAFGINLDCQNNPDEPFVKSFVIVAKLLGARSLQPWLYPDAVYKLLPYQTEYEKHKAVVHNFVFEAIKSKQKSLKENSRAGKSIHEMKSFLEILLEKSSDGRGFTTVEIFEETLVVVVAGTDSSAVGISFATCLMAKHPDVQEKVYEELYEVFGDSDRLVSHADLQRLKYLDAVIKETLRLYPPVPVFVRKIQKNTELPSGVTLLEGCSVMVNAWAVHRNPQYWGEDAELFRPERFIGPPLKHPAAFITFSHGPRSCLGYQLAMMSIKTSLATILRSYRVLNADETKVNTVDHEPFKLRYDVMMKDDDEFKVKLEKRTNRNFYKGSQ